MFEKVLIGIDFSPFTDRLLGCAEEFAAVGLREVVLLHVIREAKGPDVTEKIRKAQAELAKLAEDFAQPGLAFRPLVETGNPAEAIVNSARRESAAFIYVGAHGRGFMSRATLGSVSESVLRLADRPVMVLQCRIIERGETYTCETACDRVLRHVLVASDFSSYFESLQPLLAEFAASFRVPMTLVHVQSGRKIFTYSPAALAHKAKARHNLRKLEELRDCLMDYCPRFDLLVVTGDPGSRIPEMAEDLDASLIVVGAFGKGGVGGELLGNVTLKVVRQSLRPVLVLKAGG